MKRKAAVISRYQSAGELAFHCCDKGEGGVRGINIARAANTETTSSSCFPSLHSFEWGTPLQFSSLFSEVCVETELKEKCVWSDCVDMS